MNFPSSGSGIAERQTVRTRAGSMTNWRQ
jgi:hypothetical protein